MKAMEVVKPSVEASGRPPVEVAGAPVEGSNRESSGIFRGGGGSSR